MSWPCVHKRYCGVFVLSLMVFLSVAANAQRLPKTVVPSHYKLFLDPSISGQKFSGEESIAVHVSQPISEITLNSLDLDITLAEVSSGGHTQQAKITYDKPQETVKLSFDGPVAAGNADLHLKYSGKLTQGLRGLYLSRSQRRMYAVTQFEGTYARMMFPSFDEPSFKATFDLSVMADKGDTAISNGRIISDEPMGDRHKMTFSTSPRMSTYLVALAIGDWQCLERTVEGIPVRVCAVPEKKDEGKFALDVAAHSLEFYNQWYGIKYPFGKLDLLAIPDYEWGGMENTASIFFRETALLLNTEGQQKPPVYALAGRASTIAHEIAHQWFGDLVTAAWWDDIWLNEGFATWMENKPVEAWHPEWKLEDSDAATTQQIIATDSLPAARAIHGDPKTSSEIKEMFDGITYQKGAAVLRMLEAYVGPEVFRKGVNEYLKQHANGNATSQEFWQAMAKVSGKPVDQIMPTFILQPGVPVVSVSGKCAGNSTSLKLEQQRFYLESKGSGAAAERWDIPMCLKTDKGSGAECFLLSKEDEQKEMKGCPAWYFANHDAKGYYRVLYEDPQNLNVLIHFAGNALSTPERIALLEDTWAMTRAGRYPIGISMHLFEALHSDHEPLIIGFIYRHLLYAEKLLTPAEKQKFHNFIRTQYSPMARELGWEPRSTDTDEQKLLRGRLLSILGEAGEPDAVAAAKKIAEQYLRQPSSTDPTLTPAALSIAAEHGTSQLYDAMTDAMNKAKSSTEYYSVLFTLPSFDGPELVRRTLQLVDTGKVRQQDYPGFFSALLTNDATRAETWDYLKKHWDTLAENTVSFGGRGSVSGLGNFCTEKDKEDVKQFFSTHRAPGAERALQQSLDAMDNCMEFKKLQQTNMEKWLASVSEWSSRAGHGESQQCGVTNRWFGFFRYCK